MVEAVRRIFPSSFQAIDYIAMTNGKASSYLVSCHHPTAIQAIFYKLTIPNLNHLYPHHSMTLHPIGAGDATAAGTVAAWQYLKHGKEMHSELKDPIKDHLDCFQVDQQWDYEAVVAFGFGLACGSASCLKEQNSVVDMEDAIAIMNDIKIERMN